METQMQQALKQSLFAPEETGWGTFDGCNGVLQHVAVCCSVLQCIAVRVAEL